MTTTPNEPLPDPQIVPSGDPVPIDPGEPEPGPGPGSDPEPEPGPLRP